MSLWRWIAPSDNSTIYLLGVSATQTVLANRGRGAVLYGVVTVCDGGGITETGTGEVDFSNYSGSSDILISSRHNQLMDFPKYLDQTGIVVFLIADRRNQR